MTKQSKKEIPSIHIKKCNSCVVCIDSCPVDCLFLSLASDGIPGHKYPHLLNENMCIGCGTCAMDCPVDAITMVARAA
ncbi:MAG: 4Fe-4S dicluster domain-containing protein [Thermodesulfobacteriota bacterium]